MAANTPGLGRARPGSTNDLPAARADGIITTVTEADVETVADLGYLAAGGTARTPVRRPKGKGHNGWEKLTNSAHARLRAPAERAFAVLKRRRILDLVRISPNRITALLPAIFAVIQTIFTRQSVVRKYSMSNRRWRSMAKLTLRAASPTSFKGSI
ncbi:transposase family protein [Streptomyces sp. NPDC101062]|uniref:transposase family protein n=1 Tax=Streptomyces sp. NPDC101062 TaxID=3366103 RepID=UPI003807DBE6